MRPTKAMGKDVAAKSEPMASSTLTARNTFIARMAALDYTCQNIRAYKSHLIVRQ